MQFCTVSLQNRCKRSVFTRSTGCCFKPVATGFYRSGSERFSFFRRLELQLKVQSFPVQSGLSPVFFQSYRPDFKTLGVEDDVGASVKLGALLAATGVGEVVGVVD